MQKIKSLKWLMMVSLFMISALTSFTMTSCSDDDDDDAESVVGAWKYQYTIDDDEESYEVTTYLLFTADGKVSFVEMSKNYQDVDYATWKQNGNQVTVTYEDEDVEEEVLTISGGKLSITYTEGPFSYTEEYTRTSDDVAKIIAEIVVLK